MRTSGGVIALAVAAVLGRARGLGTAVDLEQMVRRRRVAGVAPAGLSAPGAPTGLPTNMPTLVPTLVPSPAPTTTPAPTGLDLSERSALELLYSSAGGQRWSTKTNWMDPAKHVSEWYGVTGGGEDVDVNGVGTYYYYDDTSGPLGTVTRVFLEENALVGSLPTEVGALVNAKYFQLSSNFLAGSLPSELGFLVNLEGFDVEANLLTASVPSELGLMTSAEDFKINANSMKAAIPSELGHLTNVEDFQLNDNSLASSIPTELGLVASVETFKLSRNSFTSSVPSELGHLTNVEDFQLNDNSLASSIPTEFGLASLVEKFKLSSNSFISSLPSELGHLTNVEDFQLNDNSLASSIPTEFGRALSFKTFQLTNNTLTFQVPTELGSLRKLRTFSLATNSLELALPTELGLVSSLTFLDVSSNCLGQRVPSSLPSELSLLSNINTLSLDFNSLTSSIPTEWGRLSGMISFKVNNNALSSYLPTELGSLSSAQTAFLSANRFSGPVPTELGDLKHIRALIISTNSFQNNIPTEIGNLRNLQTFDASGNSLTGGIPREIGSIGNNLGTISLDDNKLASTIPSSLCNLNGLRIFSIADNMFTGSLLECLHGFQRVEVFNAARNRFTGGLPSLKLWPRLKYLLLHRNKLNGKFEDLGFNGSSFNHTYFDHYGSNLEALTLHYNQLQGTIPKDISMPRSLKTLTIAHNDLNGSIHHNLLRDLETTNSSVTFLAMANRLSCALPRHWKFNSTKQSLVLIGNAFSAPAPSWVNEFERSSSFLTEVIRPVWTEGVAGIPSWMGLCIQGGAIALVSVPTLVWYHRAFVSTLTTGSDTEGTLFKPTSQALLRCSRGIAYLGTATSVVFIPLFYLGANFYECGDKFKRYTTMAYLMESPMIELALACLSVVWTAVLCVVLRRFLPESSLASRLKQRQCEPTSEPAIQVAKKSRTAITCWFCFYLTCWMVGLAGLGAAYLSTYALPQPNIFGTTPTDVGYLDGFLAFYLSLVSSFLIPFVTKPTVRALLGEGSSEAAIREWESIFAMVARTLVVLVFPMILTIVLDDSCFAYWTRLWEPCHTRIFEKNIPVDYLLYSVINGSEDVFTNYNVTILEKSDVCSTGLESYETGKCSRAILEILFPIFASKLVYSILIAATKPLIVDALEALPRYERRFPRLLGTSIGTVLVAVVLLIFLVYQKSLKFFEGAAAVVGVAIFAALVAIFIRTPFCRRIRRMRRRRAGGDGDDGNVNDGGNGDGGGGDDDGDGDGGGVSGEYNNDDLMKERAGAILPPPQPPLSPPQEVKEPDPMHALIWYETALVFGSLSPLLVLLLAAQLYADAMALEWSLRRAPSATSGGASVLPILGRVLKAHLLVVLFFHGAVVVFFFVDNQFKGWKIVAGGVPAVILGDLLIDCWQRRKQAAEARLEAERINMPRRSSDQNEEAADDEEGMEEKASAGVAWEDMPYPYHPWGGEYLDESDEGRSDSGRSDSVVSQEHGIIDDSPDRASGAVSPLHSGGDEGENEGDNEGEQRTDGRDPEEGVE